ncbi:hypothetical protein, partial [Stutzerimonas nitrititolerans]|uniref:hypothetical protein n=1 Tax=Stutzerimonas nitrititolerans TaxID=2482751 RepID=UPI0028A5EA6F
LDILHGMVGLIGARLPSVSMSSIALALRSCNGCRAEQLTFSHTGTPPAGDMPPIHRRLAGEVI